MRGRDMILASLTSVVWGLGFVASKIALESFSAPQLTALRFLLACIPALVTPRPALSWRGIGLIGLTLFTGQFLLLFSALALGMPPGLASVTQQMQAFFTVLLAALFLRDVPSVRQGLGITIAFTGLGLVAATAGADLPSTALGLALAGAFSWAVGNVLVKRTPGVPMFALVVWASVVPPVPALLVSRLADHGPPLGPALLAASWRSLAAVVYLGALATLWAYATWGRLLRRYSTAVVAPFALLAPCTGVVSSALVFGEVSSPARYAGMALILGGLGVIVLPAPGRRRAPAAARFRPPRA